MKCLKEHLMKVRGVMMNKHEDYQDALNDIIHNTLNNWEYKNDSFWLMQQLVDRATPKKS